MEPEPNGRVNWGRRIDTEGLEDLYAPREVEPYTVPRAGVDNLSLSSVDSFLMRDGGDFQVEFEGYFRVARAEPTTDDWSTAEVYVNLVDMRLTGKSEQLGTINVRINPDVVGAGQTFPPGLPGVAATGSTAKCRIAAGVTFEAADTGVTLYNAEPILLMNDAIEAIPPLGPERRRPRVHAAVVCASRQRKSSRAGPQRPDGLPHWPSVHRRELSEPGGGGGDPPKLKRAFAAAISPSEADAD